jgi:tyrosine-specific transport protein
MKTRSLPFSCARCTVSSDGRSDRRALVSHKRSRALLGMAVVASAASSTEAFQVPPRTPMSTQKNAPPLRTGTTFDNIPSQLDSSPEAPYRSDAVVIPESPSSWGYGVEEQHQEFVFAPTSTPDLSLLWSDTIQPVLTASLLITGNTVGAGCLAMPELVQGPGLLPCSVLLVVSYLLNLMSGLLLAEIAIRQQQAEQPVSSSFQELAMSTLQSPLASKTISALSLLVNCCVLVYNFGQVGFMGSVLAGQESVALWAASAWGLGQMALLATQSTKALSEVASGFVLLLFASFGALLAPKLYAFDLDATAAQLWQPGLDHEPWAASLPYVAPVLLMATVYQNIVPTIAKLLDFDRAKTFFSITVGSFIPLVMYLVWCLACSSSLNGTGMDWSIMGFSHGWEGIILAIFSLATLVGSSLSTGMSVAEEVDDFLQPVFRALTSPPDREETPAASTLDVPSPLAAVAASVGPLWVAFGMSSHSVTDALSFAGLFGTPILYGAIPILMAWRQGQNAKEADAIPQWTALTLEEPSPRRSSWAPAFGLGLLGVTSSGFFGEEIWSRVSAAGIVDSHM